MPDFRDHEREHFFGHEGLAIFIFDEQSPGHCGNYRIKNSKHTRPSHRIPIPFSGFGVVPVPIRKISLPPKIVKNIVKCSSVANTSKHQPVWFHKQVGLVFENFFFSLKKNIFFRSPKITICNWVTNNL